MRAYLIAIALIVAVLGSIGGFQYLRIAALAGAVPALAPVTIAAATATTEQWTRRLDAVGTLRALNGINLTAEVGGQVTAIQFQSGDRVVAGQPLLVLNDEIEVAARQNEAAALELARVLFERDRKLIAQKSIAQTQFDRSRADFARAQAQLAETEARIRNKRVRAPFGGTIGIRRVDLGDYVEPGTVIASLQDTSELEVDFTVPARYTPVLHPDLAISVQVDGFPGRVYPAALRAIDASVDADTRNLLLRARLLEHEGLLPGMFATLAIDLGAAEPVVTVPETAITYSLQGDTLYVIEPAAGGGLTAVTRVVKTGATRAGRTAILAGLASGERIVTAGQNKLFRGVAIVVDDNVTL